jgi:predicted dehydrogenase
MTHKTLRIGIIGSGFMGRTYAECLAKHTRKAALAAVVGGTRAQELAHDYVVPCEPSITSLLQREDVDAVIITTPETAHEAQTQEAAKYGKHVLVEKPMAPTIEACTAMIQACAKANVILMPIQSQRFRSVNAKTHQLIQDGIIGRVRQIRHWITHPLSHAESMLKNKPFYADPDGGGAFMGFNSHSMDMIRWLAGSDPRSIYAKITTLHESKIPHLTMMGQIEFQNDTLAQIWWSVEMPGTTFPESRFHTQVVGTKGILDCPAYQHLDLYNEAGHKRIWTQPAFDPKNPHDPVRLVSFSTMVQEFIDAIHENRKPSVLAEDGRASIELCQAALRSSELGLPVSFPLPEESLRH